jgi:hypothetical protein
LELADIVRAYGPELRTRYSLSATQLRALADIERCRTDQLGGFTYHCDDCDFDQPQYRSCGNRHCPKCQALEQERWIAQRLERILPVEHFHLVFTLPGQLRSLTRFRSKPVFDLLFRVSADTLLEFARNPDNLGAEPAITAVLHTWTRELSYHPHLHCIVAVGGLSLDGQSWVPGNRKFLFPVKALGKVFRAKFLDGLRRLYNAGDLDGFDEFDDPQGFDRLAARLPRKKWVVYCKRPFASADHVFKYLGRYTHRVGIANSRLVSVVDRQVTFRTKNGKHLTLDAVEFLGRYVQHVLPKGFVKIRHYGLLAPSNVATKLERARTLVTATTAQPASTQSTSAPIEQTWRQRMLELTGVDLAHCPRCGSTTWRPRPLPNARDPPVAA